MARATRIRRLVVPPGCYSRVLNLENACEWKRNGKGGRRSWVSFSRVSSRDIGKGRGEGKGGFFRFDRVPLSNIRRLTGHRETMDVMYVYIERGSMENGCVFTREDQTSCTSALGLDVWR